MSTECHISLTAKEKLCRNIKQVMVIVGLLKDGIDVEKELKKKIAGAQEYQKKNNRVL